MARWAWVVVVLPMLAHAEQWADEGAPAVEPGAERAEGVPLFGFLAALHVTLTERNEEAPFPGVRVGLRVALGEHLAVALLATWELEAYRVVASTNPLRAAASPEAFSAGHVALAMARLELFSSSAFRSVFVPKLAVGVFAGVGATHRFAAGLRPSFTAAVVRAGLSLTLLRLEPSGWWFPVLLELGQEFAPGFPGNGWYFAVGVGV